jgi:uncharacterized protein with ATP-grasp and redox domains
MPEIVRRTAAGLRRQPDGCLPGAAGRLERLADDLPDGLIRPIEDPAAPDTADWERYTAPRLGRSWLEADWFFTETYLYRRIAALCGYFALTDHRAAVDETFARRAAAHDPFAAEKRAGLEACAPAVEAGLQSLRLAMGRPDPAAALMQMLNLSLWGNQADLSLWPTAAGDTPEHAADGLQRAHLILDQIPASVEHLLSSPPGRVDIVLDNQARELVADLALTAYLLHTRAAESVTLHLKAHPTFVSDATAADFYLTLDALAGLPGDAPMLADGLRGSLADGRLRLQNDWFWTSPLPIWEMPDRLRAELSASRLVIFKGDANYRRLLGDLHWRTDDDFAAILRGFPAALLALRVLKSELAVGLQPGQAEAIAARDPAWMIDGRWAMASFVG